MMLTLGADGEPRLARYWDLQQAAAGARLDAASGADEAGLLRELGSTLPRAVRNEMVSDVPLGAFLSGGPASSLAPALLHAPSSPPPKPLPTAFTAAPSA